MVITGDPFGESSIAVFLDAEELLADEPDDIMGVGLTMSAYFLFNIKYRKPTKSTDFSAVSVGHSEGEHRATSSYQVEAYQLLKM